MEYTITSGIQAAVNKLKPGDRLIVKPGLYRERTELACKGTEAQPIDIVFEEGAIVRGTTLIPAADLIHVTGNVYRFTYPFEVGRVVQMDPWAPIRVTDPHNGATFVLEKPALMERVPDVETVPEVPGTYATVPTATGGSDVIAHLFCPLGEGIEVGQRYDGNVIVGSQWTRISGLTQQFGPHCLWYKAVNTTLVDSQLLATTLYMRGSFRSQLQRLHIENVITRGETHEWHYSGNGTASSITDDCRETVIDGLTARNNWNGPSFGGTNTTVRNIQVCNCPNHGIGLGMVGGHCSQLSVWNTQDALWMDTVIGTIIEDSYFTGAYLMRACKNVSFRNNVVLGDGFKVLAGAHEQFASDFNLFVYSGPMDYRYNGLPRAKSIQEVRDRFGFEMHSLQVTDVGTSAGALNALRSITDLTKR